MGKDSEDSTLPPTYNLSNLSFSHIPYQVPLPRARPISSTSAGSQSTANLSQPLNPALLARVSELLLTADASYVKLRYKAKQDRTASTMVEQQLEALHRGIFLMNAQGLGHASAAQNVPPSLLSISLLPEAELLNYKRARAAHQQPIIHQPEVAPEQVQPSHRKKRSKVRALDTEPTEPATNLTDEFVSYLDGLLSVDDAGEETMPEFLSLKQLRQLSEQVFKLKSQGAVHAVPVTHLAQLLRLLKNQIQFGHERTLQDDDMENSDSFLSLMESLEACVCCLYILSSPGVPREVYREDVIEQLLDFLKFNLQHNVYVFHDLHCRQLYRPSTLSGEEDDDAETPKHRGKLKRNNSAKKPNRKALPRVPKTAVELMRRLCNAVQLVGQLLDKVQLEGSCLLPFLRVLFQGLGLPGLDLLHSKIAGVVVGCFRVCVSLRQSVFEEYLALVMLSSSSGRQAGKGFLASEDGSTTLNTSTALLLQMIQMSVDLPSLDTEPKDLSLAYRPAYYWADVFWSSVCDRIPAGRTAKADAELDVKAVMETILTDLLSVYTLPEWPAASTLLLCCLSALCSQKGLQHAEHAPRQLATDLLGIVLSRLWRDGRAAEMEMASVKEDLTKLGYLSPDANTASDVSSAARELIVNYLAASANVGGSDVCSSALTYVLCQSLADEVVAGQKNGASAEDLTLLLVNHRQLMEPADKPQLKDLASSVLHNVSRLVVHGGRVGRAKSSKLNGLLDAADIAKQNATTRAKAIKALGLVVESDTRCLGLPDVQSGVNKALQDEAISVREAAVDLLGRHMSTQEDLAMSYFDTLGRAAADPGTSVRKRALKILWECCIKRPTFPRCTEACTHVLMRAADNEESVQKLVKEVFHQLWFSNEDGNHTLSLRAERLAQVSSAVYEAGSKGIHLPLDTSHKLVVVLRSALALDDKDGRHSGKAGGDIARALLDKLLSVAETEDSELQEFEYLLALHALCVTDPSLCIPRDDPERFLRTLAPYIKVSNGGDPKQQTSDSKRRGAERLLCIVSVMDALLGQLGRPNSTPVDEMMNDLVLLICNHLFVQVVAAACRCLCTLALVDDKAGSMLCKRIQVCTNMLNHVLNNDAGSMSPQEVQSARAHASRYLFILGQLCRHGADVIESERCSSMEHPSMKDCLELCLAFITNTTFGVKVQEAALQTMGLLFISRPQFMLLDTSRGVVKSTLTVHAPLAVKTRAISNLLELLKAEGERLVSKQQVVDAASGGGIPGLSKTPGAKYIPKTNGEGDTLSLSSSILQDNWECVLELAVDTSRPSQQHAQRNNPADPNNALVRRRTLELMEAVLRDGLVAPWTAIPTLMALVTDPNEECANKALRLLKSEAEKHAALFDGRLAQGVLQAYHFHASLAKEYGLEGDGKTALSVEVLRGMCSLYVNVIQPNKSMRSNFLQMLVKPFDTGSCLTTKGAASADTRFLYFCAQLLSGLPFKRGDECYLLVYYINAILSRRAELVFSAFKASLTGKGASPVPPSAGTAVPTPQRIGAGDRPEGTGVVVTEDVDVHMPSSTASPARPPSKSSSDIKVECKASLAISLLLLLKRYLIHAYAMTPDKIMAFQPVGDLRKQEERNPVTKLQMAHKMEFLNLHAPDDPELMREQYKAIKALMKEDSTDYADSYLPSTNKKKNAAKAAAAMATRAQDVTLQAAAPHEQGAPTPPPAQQPAIMSTPHLYRPHAMRAPAANTLGAGGASRKRKAQALPEEG